VDKNWYVSTSEIEGDAGNDAHSLDTFRKLSAERAVCQMIRFD